MEDVTNIASSSKMTHTNGPVATGAGFFTPDATSTFRGWRPDPGPPQPFRMGMPNGFRDAMYVCKVLWRTFLTQSHRTMNDSFYPSDTPIIGSQLRPPPFAVQAPGLIPRPLSSAEETGPVPKKPRSLSRTTGVAEAEKLRQTNAGAETRSKKARVRQVLMSANFFSSSSQLHAPSNWNKQSAAASTRSGRNDPPASNNVPVGSRRSTRLLSGTGKHVVKVRANIYHVITLHPR